MRLEIRSGEYSLVVDESGITLEQDGPLGAKVVLPHECWQDMYSQLGRIAVEVCSDEQLEIITAGFREITGK